MSEKKYVSPENLKKFKELLDTKYASSDEAKECSEKEIQDIFVEEESQSS